MADLSNMTVEEIKTKFSKISRQAISIYCKKYKTDIETFQKITEAKSLLKEERRNTNWGKVRSRDYEGQLWYGVMDRCNPVYQEKLYGAYIGVTCSESFKNFRFFTEWCEAQKGFKCKDENGRYFEIDKDILSVNGKRYSEDVCVFVPQEINTFFAAKVLSKRGLPRGIDYRESTKKYVVHYNKKYHGSFLTAEEAFLVYKKLKEGRAKHLARKWDSFVDNRVVQALLAYEVQPYSTTSALYESNRS